MKCSYVEPSSSASQPVTERFIPFTWREIEEVQASARCAEMLPARCDAITSSSFSFVDIHLLLLLQIRHHLQILHHLQIGHFLLQIGHFLLQMGFCW